MRIRSCWITLTFVLGILSSGAAAQQGRHSAAVSEIRQSFRMKRAATTKATAGKNTQQSNSALAATDIESSIEDALKANRSVPWSIVLGLTLLTLLPALLLSFTPLVRLLVVFHFLRQALGTQTAPSNQVLMGLALMMT